MSARWGGDDLLEPIAAEEPCGENLEDTPLLASFDTFRLFGHDRMPDARPDPGDNDGKRLLPPPEWGEIKSRSLEALSEKQGYPFAGALWARRRCGPMDCRRLPRR